MIGQEAAAFGSPDNEAGQVEIILGIHAGHFRRLAADQGAAGLFAALGNAPLTMASPRAGSSLEVAR